MAGKPLHEFATRVGIGFQNPATQLSGVTGTVFEEVALGPMNLGLPARETVERTHGGARDRSASRHLAEREPRRLSGGQAQLVVIASLLAMRPRHISSSTSRPPSSTRRGRGSSARRSATLAATGTALLDRRAQDRPARRRCATGSSCIDARADRRSTARPTTVLADPRLDGWGVEPPARVRLARALTARGLDPRSSSARRLVA